MIFPLTKGQRIVIELKTNQIFEGDVIEVSNKRIDLVNAIEYPLRLKLCDAPLSYYVQEIESITVLEELPSKTSPSNNIITLPRKQYECLMDMSQQYMYLPVMDINYIAAIERLNSIETIGVVGLGSKNGRNRRLSLLVLASWNQVFIFDLQFYRTNTFPPELKAILESNNQQKIVHDSSSLVDCLLHSHNMKLNNFFDTLIADLQIQKDSTGHVPQKCRKWSECLADYFNFPSSFLQKALDVGDDEWHQRPLSPMQKLQAAQLATYLITLKNKQQYMMLKDCYDTMAAYSQGLTTLPMVDT